jgi:hypothetical protein
LAALPANRLDIDLAVGLAEGSHASGVIAFISVVFLSDASLLKDSQFMREAAEKAITR